MHTALLDSAFIENPYAPVDAAGRRRYEFRRAIIDTDALLLSLPKSIIEQLGLTPLRPWSSGGPVPPRFSGVRLVIGDRDCFTEVIERTEDDAILIGRLPLMMLDLVLDVASCRLIGNPEHGGEPMFEMYCLA